MHPLSLFFRRGFVPIFLLETNYLYIVETRLNIALRVGQVLGSFFIMIL